MICSKSGCNLAIIFSLAIFTLAGCAAPTGSSTYTFDLAGFPNESILYKIIVQSRNAKGNLLDNFELSEKQAPTDAILKKQSLNTKATAVFVYMLGNNDYPAYFNGWDLTSGTADASRLLQQRYWLNYRYYFTDEAHIVRYGFSDYQAVPLVPGDEPVDMTFNDRPYYLFTLPSSSGHSYQTTLTLLDGTVWAAAGSLFDLNLRQDFQQLADSEPVELSGYLAVIPEDYNQSSHATIISEEESTPTAKISPSANLGRKDRTDRQPSVLNLARFAPRN